MRTQFVICIRKLCLDKIIVYFGYVSLCDVLKTSVFDNTVLLHEVLVCNEVMFPFPGLLGHNTNLRLLQISLCYSFLLLKLYISTQLILRMKIKYQKFRVRVNHTIVYNQKIKKQPHFFSSEVGFFFFRF